jgi:hypothetical protein
VKFVEDVFGDEAANFVEFGFGSVMCGGPVNCNPETEAEGLHDADHATGIAGVVVGYKGVGGVQGGWCMFDGDGDVSVLCQWLFRVDEVVGEVSVQFVNERCAVRVFDVVVVVMVVAWCDVDFDCLVDVLLEKLD